MAKKKVRDQLVVWEPFPNPIPQTSNVHELFCC